jgi:putative radical SAM enzyme (TIGR03279 family)
MIAKDNSNKIKIKKVLEGSIAEECGILSGDVLISINGEKIIDVFDYQFFLACENLFLTIQSANDDEITEYEIDKDEYEDIGLSFENEMMDEMKSCQNKCIFCFIDQLPKNSMRETLYFKDDDSRMSFLTGNYISLTNMKYADIGRIVKFKMSPVNISVHTTNPELRVRMLNNKRAGEVLKYIKILTDNGIIVNTQIVLCREINDGDELEKSVNDLAQLFPSMHSISVVPVGITKYREENGLFKLIPFDEQSSLEVVEQIETLQRKFKRDKKSNVVYLADEFYLNAKRQIPDAKEYEDFPQIENGVGMMASFLQEFEESIATVNTSTGNTATVGIITGVAAFEMISGCANRLAEQTGISVKVYPVVNRFFGERVTVAGLLTGRDIIDSLKLESDKIPDLIYIPSNMLRSGEEIFLDDVTVSELEKEIGAKVLILGPSGDSFVNGILFSV